MRSNPVPFGKYTLLDRVNTGGMAEVFRAKAFGVEGFERIVAVKRILPSIAADTDFITMFIDEAKLAVQLNHANIAQIFDLGKVGDSYFIALEYVHGKDMRAVFNRVRELDETFPIELACYVIMKICEGLDYAHGRRDANGQELGLVHRDVSPQNLLISYDGDVKLIDFGIAKAAGKASKTRTGVLKGKFGYLSPEQVRGEEVDRRSDIFGLGIVLFELLTGERLFLGDSDFSTIEKVRSVEVPSLRSFNPMIPDELEEIVLGALSRDLTTRYQTALELHDALQDFLHAWGEPFGRKELSAWMLAQFPEDANRDLEEVGNLEGADSLAFSPTDATPIVELMESSAVYNENRDPPDEEAKPKQRPQTILGMPAVLPPADLATPHAGGSHVPPRPPRTTGFGTRPPPPPPPAALTGRSAPPPPPRSPSQLRFDPYADDHPTAYSLPSPVGPGTLPPGGARRLPTNPPIAGTGTPPRGPTLNMDWDDEDLSTQIYDRPNDLGDLYESIEASFDAVAAPRTPQPRAPLPSPMSSPPGYGSGAGNGYGTGPASAYGTGSGNGFGPGSGNGFGTGPGNGFGTGSGGGYPSQPPYSITGEGTPPPGVHISQRAYAHSEPALRRVEPAGSLRAPPVTQDLGERPFERSKNPLVAMLAVAGVLFLCFVGYLFLARTEPGIVQLTTQPADATLLFDGKPIGDMSPFVITGVSPNDKHTVLVQKEGFKTWSQEVQVQAGQTLQLIPVTLQPAGLGEPPAVGASTPAAATGGFSIETAPSGAAVILDGHPLSGVTPLRVGNLSPRPYEVRLKLPGFREHVVRVDVRSGVDQPLARVVLDPERVRVRISSEPSGSEAVVVRGGERRALGRTPVDVTLENDGSPWTVEVSRSGYALYAQPITIEGGASEQSVRAVLTRRGGDDDDARDVEPQVASHDTPRASSRSSSASAGESAPTRSSEGGEGTLRINSRPWSQVTIDGKSVGNTPQMSIQLPAGNHRVTLVNPEFNLRKNLTIHIKPGQIETQIVTLQ